MKRVVVVGGGGGGLGAVIGTDYDCHRQENLRPLVPLCT